VIPGDHDRDSEMMVIRDSRDEDDQMVMGCGTIMIQLIANLGTM
jgi:hypothetical protein